MQLPGIVYALGNEALSAASLYARLTGRDCRTCVVPKEVKAEGHDVVICSTSRLSPSLMHHLYIKSRSSGGVPGLIYARTASELEDVCRLQAAKFVRDRSIARRIFILPLLPFTLVERGADIFVGGSLPTQELLSLLTSGSAMLFISTHSDGIDLFLSQRVLACPFSSPLPEDELRPMCQILGRCTRMYASGRSVAQAWESGLLVPLTALRADVVVFPSCRIVRVLDGIVDPAYGLAAAFLRQSDFGALITTWRSEASRKDGAHVNSLINNLCMGTMAGTAVGMFNASADAAAMGLNLCLIGDPCFALARNETFSPLPIPEIDLEATSWPSPAGPSSYGSESKLSALLLQEAVTEALSGGELYFDSGKGERLLAMLASFLKGEALSASTKVPDELDLALLDFVGPAPGLQNFLPDHRMIGMSEDAICPACLAPARSFHMAFPKYGASPWRVFRCACCNDWIVPQGWKIEMEFDHEQRVVSFSGIPKNSKMLFSVNRIYGGFNSSLFQQQVRADAGNNRFSFRIPDHLPPIPLRCNLFIADRLQLACVGFMIASRTNGALSTTRRVLWQTESLKGQEVTQ